MDPCGPGREKEEEFSQQEFGAGRAKEEEFTQEEFGVAMALLEFARQMQEMWQFPPWGLKKKRSRTISASCRGDFNYDDEVKEEQGQEQEEEQGVHATLPKRIMAAAGEDKVRKRSRVQEAGKKEGSPTTPLTWTKNERVSGSTSGGGAAGDRSDTASQAELRLISAAPPARPCDRQLGHRPAPKVEIGDKVHNPSSRRGPKKKTNEELKEWVKELSLEKKELEKEKKRRLQLLQSLRDENESLKAKVALCSEKEEAKRPATPPEISCDLAQKTEGFALLKSSFGHVELECSENLDVNSPLAQVMDGTSSIGKYLPPHHVNMNNSGNQDLVITRDSRPEHLILPDLNIALDMDDTSDNSFGGCKEQVPPPNKAVVAAEARKHRKECLKGKCSQLVNARVR